MWESSGRTRNEPETRAGRSVAERDTGVREEAAFARDAHRPTWPFIPTSTTRGRRSPHERALAHVSPRAHAQAGGGRRRAFLLARYGDARARVRARRVRVGPFTPNPPTAVARKAARRPVRASSPGFAAPVACAASWATRRAARRPPRAPRRAAPMSRREAASRRRSDAGRIDDARPGKTTEPRASSRDPTKPPTRLPTSGVSLPRPARRRWRSPRASTPTPRRSRGSWARSTRATTPRRSSSRRRTSLGPSLGPSREPRFREARFRRRVHGHRGRREMTVDFLLTGAREDVFEDEDVFELGRAAPARGKNAAEKRFPPANATPPRFCTTPTPCAPSRCATGTSPPT